MKIVFVALSFLLIFTPNPSFARKVPQPIIISAKQDDGWCSFCGNIRVLMTTFVVKYWACRNIHFKYFEVKAVPATDDKSAMNVSVRVKPDFEDCDDKPPRLLEKELGGSGNEWDMRIKSLRTVQNGKPTKINVVFTHVE